MDKFKVGDKVKVIKNSFGCIDCEIGQSYELLKINKDRLILFTHLNSPKENNMCRFSFEDVELVNSELEILVEQANVGL